MAPNDPKKVKLELNRTTIRKLRKADLEQVVGGTILGGITLSFCTEYCCFTQPGYETCYNCPPIFTL
jgi:hypothetical protein